MVKKGTLVVIKKIVLNPNERSLNIPNDTKDHPFLMWIKGVLTHDADFGDLVSILTTTKRIETGILIQIEPYYTHSFGKYVDILDEMKEIISKETEGLS